MALGHRRSIRSAIFTIQSRPPAPCRIDVQAMTATIMRMVETGGELGLRPKKSTEAAGGAETNAAVSAAEADAEGNSEKLQPKIKIGFHDVSPDFSRRKSPAGLWHLQPGSMLKAQRKTGAADDGVRKTYDRTQEGGNGAALKAGLIKPGGLWLPQREPYRRVRAVHGPVRAPCRRMTGVLSHRFRARFPHGYPPQSCRRTDGIRP